MDGLYGENPIKMDDLEVPPFIEPPILRVNNNTGNLQ